MLMLKGCIVNRTNHVLQIRTIWKLVTNIFRGVVFVFVHMYNAGFSSHMK